MRPLTLDILSPLVLKNSTLSSLIEDVESRWNGTVDQITIPLVYQGGAVTDLLEGHFTEIVNLSKTREIEVIPSLNLEFVTVTSDLFDIIAWDGGTGTRACPISPYTPRIIRPWIESWMQAVGDRFAPKRFLIEAQDLWPVTGRIRINPHCFCRHCLSMLNECSPGLMDGFQKSPNPWDLALLVTKTGISHFNQLSSRTTSSEFAEQLAETRFLQSVNARLPEGGVLAGSTLEDWCGQTLNYARARHTVTIRAFERLQMAVSEIFGVDLHLIVPTTDFGYDWTAGTFLDLLPAELPVESTIWMDPTSNKSVPNELKYTPYMSQRAQYYYRSMLDAFEELSLWNYMRGGDPIDDASFQQAERSVQRGVGALTAPELALAFDDAERLVVPALDRESSYKLFNELSEELEFAKPKVGSFESLLEALADSSSSKED